MRGKPLEIKKTKILFLILAVIITASFGVRLWGLSHGYPYSYYPDEAHLIKRALAFGSGDLNPHWFHKPAFFLYVLFVEYGLLFVIGKLSGMWESVSAFAVYYIDSPGIFIMLGRVTVVICSVGSVFLTWLIGQRIFSQTAGLIASFLMAFSFGAISTAKDLKLDAPCAFFTLLSCYFLCLFVEQPAKEKSRIWLLLSVIIAGIGTATKVYSVVMLVPIGIAVLLYDSGSVIKRLRRILSYVGLLYLTYFICSPFNFIDPHGRKFTFGPFYTVFDKLSYFLGFAEPKEVEGVSKEIQNLNHSLGDFVLGFIDYLQKLSIGLNWFVLVLAVLGVVALIKYRHRAGLILLIFPLLFASISIFLNPGYADLRHQSPVYPFVALAAGYMFSVLSHSRPAILGFIILLLGFSAFDIARISTYNAALSQQDVRNLARLWIEENIPAESDILLDEEGPVLRKSKAQLDKEIMFAKSQPAGPFTTHYGSYLDYQALANEDKVTYNIFEIRIPWWRSSHRDEGVEHLESDFDADMGNPLRPIGVLSYGEYVEAGYQFAIIQSGKFQNFIDGKGEHSFPAYYKLYNTLFTQGEIVKTFKGNVPTAHPGALKQLTIHVIKLK